MQVEDKEQEKEKEKGGDTATTTTEAAVDSGVGWGVKEKAEDEVASDASANTSANDTNPVQALSQSATFGRLGRSMSVARSSARRLFRSKGAFRGGCVGLFCVVLGLAVKKLPSGGPIGCVVAVGVGGAKWTDEMARGCWEDRRREEEREQREREGRRIRRERERIFGENCQ